MIVSHLNLTRLFRVKRKSFKACCFVNARHDVKFLFISKTNCLLQFFFIFRLFRKKIVCYDRNYFFIKISDYSESININDSLNFSNVLSSMIESQSKFKNLNLNENVNNDKRNKKQRRNRFNFLKNNVHIVNLESHVLIAIYDDFFLNSSLNYFDISKKIDIDIINIKHIVIQKHVKYLAQNYFAKLLKIILNCFDQKNEILRVIRD